MTATAGGSTRRLSPAVVVNVYVGFVVACAVAAVVLFGLRQPVTTGDVRNCAVLAVLAVGYDWLARRVEVVRRRTDSGPYVSMDSVWVMAAAINLPLPLTAALFVVIQIHAEYQSRRAGAARPLIRNLFNVGAVVLPAAAATELVRRSGAVALPFGTSHEFLTPAVLIGVVFLYTAVNTALVGVVIALSSGERRLANLAGTTTENIVEIATLTLGVLVGVALTLDVWLALLAVPILVLLQRIALVEHLESAASEDSKTGLLNAAAFNHVVERDLERARIRVVPAAVMVIDLDHFKRVNDTFGHLTGDVVLRAVAECMRTMLRDRDQIARFGGEEFVAFLPGADHAEALKVAERLRRRIADTAVDPVGRGAGDTAAAAAGVPPGVAGSADTRQLVRITASIGVATFPQHGESLVDLLAQADSALYAAKNNGRNQIRSAD